MLTTSVQVPQGRITFYRYVKEQKCGAGVIYRISGQAGHNQNGGGGPCTNRTNSSPLTNNAMRHSKGSTPFVLLHGLVNDDRIARVMVRIGDSEPREADVVYGFWYLFLPGATAMPPYTVQGQDGEGMEVPRAAH